MIVHQAKAVRAGDGWSRWSAACGCSWRQQGHSKEDAQRLALEHNEIAAVARVLRCECWHGDVGEFDPDGPCPRCRLEAVLVRAS